MVYQQEWFTPNVECQAQGKGDGKETEGLAFLSPNPLGSPTMTKLPASRIALTIKPAFAGGVAITATHFANGKQNGPARANEVAALLKWTEKFGANQIVLGDFNLKPDEPELQPMLTMFRDAWKTASDAGVATGAGDTHGTSRIDYIFHKGEGVAVTKVDVVDTATWLGTAASDHRPVVATVRLTHVLK